MITHQKVSADSGRFSAAGESSPESSSGVGNPLRRLWRSKWVTLATPTPPPPSTGSIRTTAAELLPAIRRPKLRRLSLGREAPAPGPERMEASLQAEVAACLWELDHSFAGLIEDPSQVDGWQRGRRIFHTLQGTLATWGWLTWAAAAERGELECARAVVEPASRNRETIERCRVDLGELTQALDANANAPAQEPAGSSWAAESAPVPVARGHILVVDDSIGIRRHRQQLLNSWGFQVSMAEDGLEALALLSQIPAVDLILTDLDMPRRNGLEFLRDLRADPRWRPLRVFVISSNGDPAMREQALSLGALDFLTKSIPEARLQRLVEAQFPAPLSPFRVS